MKITCVLCIINSSLDVLLSYISCIARECSAWVPSSFKVSIVSVVLHFNGRYAKEHGILTLHSTCELDIYCRSLQTGGDTSAVISSQKITLPSVLVSASSAKMVILAKGIAVPKHCANNDSFGGV